MARPIKVHQVGGAGIPEMRHLNHTSGATFVKGEPVIWSAGEIAGAGANPALGTIVGIALAAVNTNPGYDAANSPATFTGRTRAVTVVIPNQQTIFSADMTNNSSTVVAPAQTDVGVQYGITAYSGAWTVDRNKTGANERVEVVGITGTTTADRVLFKFLNTALTTAS